MDLKTNDIYDLIDTEIPKTSMPAIGDAMELLEKLQSEGYTQALSIHLSKGLSGTFEMVWSLRDKARELGIHLEVVDSNSISMGLGFLVMRAARMREAGASLEEILAAILRQKEDTKVFFVVKTLEYLRRGGRIGRIEGGLGDLLNFKPIISINKEGVYYTVEKVRGRKKSLKAIAELAEKEIAGRKMDVSILHGKALEEAQEIYDEFQGKVASLSLYDITSALGVHVGPGLIGICMSPAE